MKKLALYFFLCSLLVVSLIISACSSTPSTTSAPQTTAPAPVTTAAKPTTAAPATTAAQPTAPVPTTAAGVKQIELKLASTSPGTVPITAKYIELENRLNQALGNRIKFTNYWSGSLLQAPEMFDGTVAGVADIAEIWNTQAQYVLSTWQSIPFLGIPDQATGTKIYKELLSKVPALSAEFKGTHPLYPMMWGYVSYLHTTNKLIQTQQDMKGVKFIGTSYTGQWLSAMGAVPVNVFFQDYYTSLSSNLVQGSVGGFASLQAAGANDILKYHLQTLEPVTFSASPIIFCQKTWDTLPPDVQKAFEDQEAWFTDYQWNTVTIKQDEDIKARLVAKGDNKFNTVSASEFSTFKYVARTVEAQWIKDMAAKGKPGQLLLDTFRSILSTYVK